MRKGKVGIGGMISYGKIGFHGCKLLQMLVGTINCASGTNN